MTRHSNNHLGRAAELKVCFDFVFRGYSAVINDFPGARSDVIVDMGQGSPILVQVKSTLKPQVRIKKKLVYQNKGAPKKSVDPGIKVFKNYSEPRYSFATDMKSYVDANISVFAFVALDIEKTLYLPAKGLIHLGGTNRRFGCKSFIERAEGSLDRFIEEWTFS